MERQHIVLSIDMIVGMMEESFAHGGCYHLTVTGTSMSPTLQPSRDQVRLVDARIRPPRRGDIVFARRQNGGYVLHRAIKLHPSGGCTLNGDGQVWTEEIYPGDILAVADAIERNGKWISCRNPAYRLYVALWALTRPYREKMVQIKKRLNGKR